MRQRHTRVAGAGSLGAPTPAPGVDDDIDNGRRGLGAVPSTLNTTQDLVETQQQQGTSTMDALALASAACSDVDVDARLLAGLFSMGESGTSLCSDVADVNAHSLKHDYGNSVYVRMLRTILFVVLFVFGLLFVELDEIRRENFSSYSIYDPFYTLPIPRLLFLSPETLVPHEDVSVPHLQKLIAYLDDLQPTARMPVPVVTQTTPRVILDGHHRVAASKHLNLSLIPVWEVDDSDEFMNWKNTFVRVYAKKRRIRLKDVVRGAREGRVEFGIKGTRHVAMVGADGREEPLERVTPRVAWGLWRLGNVFNVTDIAIEDNGDLVISTDSKDLPELIKESEYFSMLADGSDLTSSEIDRDADPNWVVYDSADPKVDEDDIGDGIDNESKEDVQDGQEDTFKSEGYVSTATVASIGATASVAATSVSSVSKIIATAIVTRSYDSETARTLAGKEAHPKETHMKAGEKLGNFTVLDE